MRILTLLAVVLFSACQKESVVPPTYELILKATKPQGGTYTFTRIQYTDADLSTKTITNQTSDFSTTLTVKEGFQMSFSVQGTVSVTGSTSPFPPLVSYQFVQVNSGGDKVDLCGQTGGSLSGSRPNYTFSQTFTRTFTTADCK